MPVGMLFCWGLTVTQDPKLFVCLLFPCCPASQLCCRSAGPWTQRSQRELLRVASPSWSVSVLLDRLHALLASITEGEYGFRVCECSPAVPCCTRHHCTSGVVIFVALPLTWLCEATSPTARTLATLHMSCACMRVSDCHMQWCVCVLYCVSCMLDY